VLSACALGALFPLLAEMRVVRARRSLTDRWQRVAVEARGTTLLGISFRTPQVEALGLDAQASLRALLAYPFQLIRLGAYWQRIEPEPGVFDTRALDWQIDAAEQAGKQIIVCLGPVKTFGYPETFVPAHQLRVPLREGALATPATHGALLKAATAQLRRLVERYRNRGSIIAWQVEQEAVDPLGVEHSWRLSRGFVGEEVALVRGRLLPVVRLYQRFEVKPRSEEICDGLLVVAESKGKQFCLLVDELLGKQEVVIKSLGETLRNIKGIAGCAILGDGRVGLILDLPGIFRENQQ